MNALSFWILESWENLNIMASSMNTSLTVLRSSEFFIFCQLRFLRSLSFETIALRIVCAKLFIFHLLYMFLQVYIKITDVMVFSIIFAFSVYSTWT